MLISRLLDWLIDSHTPAVFGPAHRFTNPLDPRQADPFDDDPFDISDTRPAELIALDNIVDQLDSLTAILEDIRNIANRLIPEGS